MSYEEVGRREVVETARWLETLGVPFIVVGGSAIAERYRMSTKDVDVLILVGSWKQLDAVLEHHPLASPLDPFSGSIRETTVILGSRRVLVEFISGEQSSGTRSPDEFVAYVRSRWSRSAGGIRYAEAAVVWYMRLCGEEWASYVHAFRRDLRAGVPDDTFRGVVRIARHLGAEEKIRPRIATVRELLQLYDPAGSGPSTLPRG